MSIEKKANRSPWWWVPSLYYAEGIPYALVMYASVVFYKRMGISNADIALYTSWLYLPWVIKPFWSPLVDILRTKRFWILTMQLLVGAGLGGVALTIPAPNFFKITIGIFWLMAFSSATHDIAADGFYMIGLSKHKQAWFVGVRSTFYRFAMITGQGLIIILAGLIESQSGLDSVDINVAAELNNGVQHEIMIDQVNDVTAKEGDLRIVCEPENLAIPIVTREKKYIDSIVNSVNDWNKQFENLDDENINNEDEIENERQSLWSKIITTPLEKFLRNNFGKKEKEIKEQSGNIGLLKFHLSKAPVEDEEIIVNFGRDRGNKNISLIAGSRFKFNKNDWYKPRMAVIKLDSKLDNKVNTTFVATSGNVRLSWIVTFAVMGGLFLLFFIYHKFAIPKIETARTEKNVKDFFIDFLKTFAEFFKKDKIGLSIAFLLLFRLGESQLVKLAAPFILDAQEAGGLAMTTAEYGIIYGTVGILLLTVGGLLGGFAAAKNGLKYWIWWMAIAINLPNAVYIFLSQVQPDSFLVVNICVGIEQFGYGFGFTAYMLYMIQVAEGKYKTAHFAIATGFMALGMMIPGMVSGWIQEIIGYEHFFIWVVIATIPGFIIIKYLPIDPEFGKKTNNEKE
ncbi:MAG: MFS transporter [Candidatus Marinimicrobia bacterium]|nr:MFS transporter [Candidatus Neomarinimicrobiota bacterium]